MLSCARNATYPQRAHNVPGTSWNVTDLSLSLTFYDLLGTLWARCGYVAFLACRCNRLRCPLARMSGLQCFNMGHNGHGINLYGVSMILMGN